MSKSANERWWVVAGGPAVSPVGWVCCVINILHCTAEHSHTHKSCTAFPELLYLLYLCPPKVNNNHPFSNRIILRCSEWPWSVTNQPEASLELKYWSITVTDEVPKKPSVVVVVYLISVHIDVIVLCLEVMQQDVDVWLPVWLKQLRIYIEIRSFLLSERWMGLKCPFLCNRTTIRILSNCDLMIINCWYTNWLLLYCYLSQSL